jgi:hypothetical protein
MAKEWANKDRYHPSYGVPKPPMPLPKGKGFVRKVPAWGDERSCAEMVVWRGRSDRPSMVVRLALPREGRSDQPSKAVRPALPRFLGSSVSEVVMLVVSVLLVMVQMVDTLSLVVLSLLDVLPS